MDDEAIKATVEAMRRAGVPRIVIDEWVRRVTEGGQTPPPPDKRLQPA